MSVIVGYARDFDCGYSICVYPSIIQPRERIVVRYEDQPIGLDKIDRVLTGAVSCQLVSPFRLARRYTGQRPSVLQDDKPTHDCLRHGIAVSRLEGALGIADPCKVTGFEGDVQSVSAIFIT